jgi:hypothetical protein
VGGLIWQSLVSLKLNGQLVVLALVYPVGLAAIRDDRYAPATR